MAPRLALGGARDLAAIVRETRRALDAEVAELSGARSEPVVAAARVLRTEIRRQVAVRGTDESPAPAGSPPHRIRGLLWRSIGTAVVDGVRRVGSGYYVARLQEFGSERRAPRPFMDRGLAAAAPQMTEVFVSEAQRKVKQAGGRGLRAGGSLWRAARNAP